MFRRNINAYIILIETKAWRIWIVVGDEVTTSLTAACAKIELNYGYHCGMQVETIHAGCPYDPHYLHQKKYT